MKRMTWRLAAAVAALVAVPTATAAGYETAAKPNQLHINVVSSPAQYVSGGDARIEIAVPDGTALGDVEVTLNGTDVTSAFGPDPEGNHQLEGVVTGLPLGPSTLAASTHKTAKGNKHYDEVTLTNNPLQGPIFSGPHQTPFVCATAGNAAGMGLPPIPQSPTCETPTVVSFVYRNLAGQFLDYDPAAPPPPSSIEMTTTMDGKTVPMILRWERGVINRFMYSILMLSPGSQTATPDLSAWNRKALFSFSGGVAIGHTQGAASSGDMRYLAGLRMGYAVLYSSGNRTNTHYNLQLGGETAIMVKDRFVSAYAEPEYTIAVGGSGGAIQQYVYGQNHPGLLDGGVPQYSYSDMVTQTIHVGDCELLERWLDSKVLANPLSMWRTWVNRTLIEGLSSSATFPNPYAAVMPYMPTPGSTECINGWRGLSPLALNPNFGTAPGYNLGGLRAGRVDALGRPGQHLRHGRDRLRPLAVGQRRRPVRARGAAGGLDHAGAVPRPERERRLLEGVEGHGPGGLSVRVDRSRRLRRDRRRRVERPQHEPLARRRRDAGRAA